MRSDRPVVVRLIARLNIGGPARQAVMLTEALGDTYVSILGTGSVDRGEAELPHDGVVPIRLALGRPIRPRQDASAVLAVRRLLRSSGAQLLHTHTAKAGFVGRIAASSLRHRRPRVVHTFHGHVLDGYFSRPRERTFVEIERALARRSDVLIAVSPQVRDDLVELRIGRESQYRVIPLGLELDPWFQVGQRDGALRKHLGLSADVPLVGAVGRLVPIKRLETLLAAVAFLSEVQVVLIGDGESRSQLEARSIQLGLGDRAHFVGWWPDIPAAMADLDAVVLTSGNEGTPVALIEALAARRPVVATSVGGVPFVVEDDVTGLLVPPDDPRAFAERLDWALRHRDEMSRMAEEGSRQVRERFTSDRLVRDIRNLYDELLN